MYRGKHSSTSTSMYTEGPRTISDKKLVICIIDHMNFRSEALLYALLAKRIPMTIRTGPISFRKKIQNSVTEKCEFSLWTFSSIP